MLEPVKFNFDGAAVRVITRDAAHDGEPWFVAADVCAVLGYDHTPSAMRRIDAHERGVHSMHTPGGAQQVATVNESGLYSLIMGSRKPEAKAFKRWVTSEVLPTIRKTGSYGVAAIPDFRNPAEAARAWAAQFEAAEALRITNGVQAAQLEHAAPRVEFANAMMNSDGTALVRDAAKTLGLPVRKLEQALRAKSVILANNAPAAKYVDKGYFKEATHTVKTNTRGDQLAHVARVTGPGLQWLRKFAVRHADLLTPNKGARKESKRAVTQ